MRCCAFSREISFVQNDFWATDFCVVLKIIMLVI